MTDAALTISSTNGLLSYEATPDARGVIAMMGRTEDVRLSPDNRRLILLDFLTNRMFLFAVRIDPAASQPVSLLDGRVLTSNSLKGPHGVAFLDDDHVVVSSRSGNVCCYRLPPIGPGAREHRLNALVQINGRGFLRAAVKSPGSLDAYPLGDGRYRVLVCNNFWNFVSDHTIHVGKRTRVHNARALLGASIKLPDGISISPDQRWLAVSNHVKGQVLVYRNTSEFSARTRPSAVLHGLVCPHGLRFHGNHRLIVADAASPYVLVYDSADGWAGEQHPTRHVRLLDDDLFHDGRYAGREGGVKGLDIDRSGRVLVTTHRLGVLDFYDLDCLLTRRDATNEAEIAMLRQDRDDCIARTKSAVPNRRWTLRARMKLSFADIGARASYLLQRLRRELSARKLDFGNRWSRRPLTDPSGPVVSLTTHGPRIHTVHRTIEAIASGTRLPSRIILWVTSTQASSRLPQTLRRQVARGLEIRVTEDLGPHTKYYPYLEAEPTNAPLVTADDDVMYPSFWLHRLIEAHRARPEVIHCFRARRLGIQHGRLTPYNDWSLCTDRAPSHLNFVTGVSGAIHPSAFLDELRRLGRAFEMVCPRADDIWLNVVALRSGFLVAQVDERAMGFPPVPGSQHQSLFLTNVMGGDNQVQLRRTYTAADLTLLQACR